nr:MAG TPA: hypothetical protein [Caudoviricetes sp.]DAT71685.1 MAG TPA: hypothetical protein [Caudoviricetes sp.]DAW12631.1 MAG TPA: hypothetical protein [Caudoviricetes sp.]
MQGVALISKGGAEYRNAKATEKNRNNRLRH